MRFGFRVYLFQKNNVKYRGVHCMFDVILKSYRCFFLVCGACVTKYQREKK